MTARLSHIAELLGPRFSRQRRIANIVAFIVVAGVLLFLYLDSGNQSDRITQLERSDCKEARITGDKDAQEGCFATSDFMDRTRPVKGLCIRADRTGYPCPLAPAQTKRLQALLGN